MSTNRTAINFFWSTVKSLVDTELVTMQLLYTEGLHRLQDNAFYAIGRVSRLAADLLSQADGGQAQIIGDVNIGAFDFNGGAALNGLTIIVDEDTTTAQTCTFPNTITTPAQLISALVIQAGNNLTWEFTSNGYLKVSSQTTGSGSTISLGAGTANTLLFGSSSVTSPGSSSVNDGASRIGVAAIANLPASALRALLEALVQGEVKTTDYSAVDADQNISETDGMVIAIKTAAADRTYTLTAPSRSGRKVMVARESGGTNDVIVTGFANGTTVVFTGTGAAEFRSFGTAWLLVQEWS